ncbi:MAG: sensor domain-containing diguanylate cyclase [Gammaproteobacteria bacterium]|nr:sensor domain-containing diguanylate cyclase [Gammaproteobacteria bacterium]
MKSLFAISLLILWQASAGAVALDLAEQKTIPIGIHTEFLQETDTALGLKEAMAAYREGRFQGSDNDILTFGVGSRPLWLRIPIHNPLHIPLRQRLAIETSWLDYIDVYFIDSGRPPEVFHTGDRYGFAERPLTGRFFAFDHHFLPGDAAIFIRVETPDPMVLPIYLSSVEAYSVREQDGGYLYGFLYGLIVALLGYNLMLFLSLRAWRYFYFAIYLGMFLVMNMSYTGHAYMWLWPTLPAWQLWANHVLILLFPMTGLIFATIFLNTKSSLPLLHKAVITACIVFSVLESLAILAQAQAVALIVSFSFIFAFSLTMVYMGGVSILNGNKSAKYFLIASVAHVTGSSITAMTTWGLIPYSIIGYHAIEIGMMLDAVLLAMALADQFRHVQEQRLRAEHLTMLDPLTGINNRRAFYELVSPLWNRAIDEQQDISVIMLDIDKFKSINDKYGHRQGDEVLSQVAQMLKECMRTSDIIARWGGEEFIVLLPMTPKPAVMVIAERCRQRLSSLSLDLAGEKHNLTVSLGVAHTDQPRGSLDELVERADVHLYEAKRKGRNRVYPALELA